MKTTPLTKTDIEAIRSAKARLSSPAVRATVRDLFTLGLFLRTIGHCSEGRKACSQALRTLLIGEARTGRILNRLDDDPRSLALSFQPHVEFLSLIERQIERMQAAT